MHLEGKIEFDKLAISDADLNDAMGYGMAIPDESVYKEVHSLLNNVASITQPRYEFFTTEGSLRTDDETLQVDDKIFHVGKIIARQLRGSEQYVFFTTTAGMEFDRLQHQLNAEGDIVKCYLVDCIGSIIAEKAADYMEMVLQENINQLSWKHTNRFSPGYCGWHVSEQAALFSIFPHPNPCGIHLTESSLMLPIKSVSGVIGIGPSVRKLEYSCKLCSFERCYRRKYTSISLADKN